MKVLLLQDVTDVGRAGEIKEVAEGYYRNYLVPRKLATAATAAALKRLAQDRQVAAHRQARVVTEGKTLAEAIKQTRLVFKVKVGEQHRLYGAITPADIAEELTKSVRAVATSGRNMTIDKRHVEMEEPIRHLGTFEVPIRIGKDLVPKVTVVVEREETPVAEAPV